LLACGELDVRPARNALIAMWGQSNDLIYIPMLAPTKCTMHGRRVFIFSVPSTPLLAAPHHPLLHHALPYALCAMLSAPCPMRSALFIPPSHLPNFRIDSRGILSRRSRRRRRKFSDQQNDAGSAFRIPHSRLQPPNLPH
jgi:hypothetical protein